MSDARESAVLQALEEVAARAAAAGRLEPPGGRGRPALRRRGRGARVRGRCRLDRPPRPGDGPARHPRRGRARRAPAPSASRSPAARASPATCSRPASRWSSATSPPTRASTGRRPRPRATSRARSWPSRSSSTTGASACSRCSTGAATPASAFATWSSRRVFARQASAVVRAGASSATRRELLRLTLARLAADPDADGPAARRGGGRDHRRPRRRGRHAAVGPGRCRRARTRAPRRTRSALVIEILDALARRAARPRREDLPPVTRRTARVERAVRRRPPGRARAARAVGPRRPRLGVR